MAKIVNNHVSVMVVEHAMNRTVNVSVMMDTWGINVNIVSIRHSYV